jgi:hypothetical protein
MIHLAQTQPRDTIPGIVCVVALPGKHSSDTKEPRSKIRATVHGKISKSTFSNPRIARSKKRYETETLWLIGWMFGKGFQLWPGSSNFTTRRHSQSMNIYRTHNILYRSARIVQTDET